MNVKLGSRGLLVCALLLACLASQVSSQQRKRQVPRRPTPTTAQAQRSGISPEIQAALDRISADSLRGHLSFIASDLLEGRNTPSRGLDLAAEYISAQFRRAGLEAAVENGEPGEKSFFQVAHWQMTEPDLEAFELSLSDGSQTLKLDHQKVSFAGEQALELKNVPLVKVDYQDAEARSKLTAEQIAGKVVVTEIPDIAREERSRRVELISARNAFMSQLKSLNAAFVVSIDRHSQIGRGLGGGRVLDPERGQPAPLPAAALMTIHDSRAVKMYDSMSTGQTRGSLTLSVAAARRKPLALKNVVGVLRGTDPVLKDSFVIVSAHYDHLGIDLSRPGDNIYNGANDDGSGTVSVIELASALATAGHRPKRSIAFICWFGEEKGLLGSRYYGKHPVFPLEKTIAMVNLEQLGRTDSTEGPQLNNASMTGFDFTDLGPIFQAAGRKTGINVYKHEKNSDAFFGRSDNQALADAGIPAHTLCVSFVYPDYHQAGDHWEKIDYPNMARVNRMIALAVLTIADNPQPPKWNVANPKTAKYVQAAELLRK